MVCTEESPVPLKASPGLDILLEQAFTKELSKRSLRWIQESLEGDIGRSKLGCAVVQ